MCLSIRSQNSWNHVMLKLEEIFKGLTRMWCGLLNSNMGCRCLGGQKYPICDDWKLLIWKDFNIKLSSWKPYVIDYAKTPLYELQSTFFFKQTFASWQQLLWILRRSWFSNAILTRFSFFKHLSSLFWPNKIVFKIH